jgi:hypothetical protein
LPARASARARRRAPLRADPTPVVLHPQAEQARPSVEIQANDAVTCFGVAHGVGYSVLGDVVGGDLDGRGQRRQTIRRLHGVSQATLLVLRRRLPQSRHQTELVDQEERNPSKRNAVRNSSAARKKHYAAMKNEDAREATIRAEEERRTEGAPLRDATRPDPPPSADHYTDRLLKYVPAESVALYLTLQGIVSSSVEGRALYTWLWFVFGIGIIGTPLYLWRIQHVSKIAQLVVSTAAFGVWVFALGGAFASPSWYKSFLGSMLLVIFTFFVPLISPDVLSSEEAT